MKKNDILKTGLVSLGAFGLFLETGRSFFEKMVVVKPKKGKKAQKKPFRFKRIAENHPRNGYEKEYEEGKAWAAAQKMTSHYITSADGLRLHASYLPAEHPVRTIILCHGYRGAAFSDFAGISRYLHEHGSNLLFIDERCCGESEGKYITFGAREKLDIQQWAFRLVDGGIEDPNTPPLPIYLYGMSMGASSVLMASGLTLPTRVKGIIADSGFRSMAGELRDMAVGIFHLRHIPLLLFRVELLCRLRAGFSMKEADTTRALKANRRPLLIIHGGEDGFVLPSNAAHNYETAISEKEILVIPKAKHISACYVDPVAYQKALERFFG